MPSGTSRCTEPSTHDKKWTRLPVFGAPLDLELFATNHNRNVSLSGTHFSPGVMLRMGRTLVIGLLVLFALSLVTASHASSTVSVRDLGVLPGYTTTEAQGINEAGRIVGTSGDGGSQSRPFLWNDGVLTNLGTLGGSRGIAHGISDTGFIAGESEVASHEMHAFLWENGNMKDLGLGVAFAVNDQGQAAGCGFPTSSAPPCHAVLWQAGQITDLGTLGGHSGSAYGIDDAGQVVGSTLATDGFMHAFLWQAGTMTDLGGLPGYQFSAAWDINAAGQVVGSSIGADGITHAVLWEAGVVRDLGNLGGRATIAYGINDAGQVVGISIPADGPIDGFLWRDGVMTKLPTPGNGDGAGSDINGAGQVVGGHYLYAFGATPATPMSGMAFYIASAGLAGATFAFYHVRRSFRPRKNPNRR